MEPNRGFTLWFTGMIGSGKSTLARYVAKRLPLIGRKVELLDHSDLQDILPEGWDAAKEVRERNVRHLGWVARLLSKHDIIAIVAATSPDRELRDEQRKRIGRFAEVFVDCPFEALQQRDEKGVYRKALAGELQNVVGIQAPYEPPSNPEARIDTSQGSVEELAQTVFQSLFQHGFISRQERDVLINGTGDARLAAVRAAAARTGAVRKARKKASAKKVAGKSAAEGKEAPSKAAASPKKAPSKAKAASPATGATKAKAAASPAKAGAKATKAAPAGGAARAASAGKAAPRPEKAAAGGARTATKAAAGGKRASAKGAPGAKAAKAAKVAAGRKAGSQIKAKPSQASKGNTRTASA